MDVTIKTSLQRQIEQEGDSKFWRKDGYYCLIMRTPELKTLCGYVGVPRASTLYGHDVFSNSKTKIQKDINKIRVHGGLTFSGKFEKKEGLPFESLSSDIWWFGFDTAHFQDLVPSMELFPAMQRKNMQYRDIKYVETEVNNLLSQIKKIDDKHYSWFWNLIDKLIHLQVI